MFLLKPGEFTIKDEWYSVGLKGSGSNTIVVREPLFVPFSFTYDNADAQAGHPPGSLLHDWLLCRIPLALNSSFAIMTPMHGIARGAYESFVGFTRDKPSRFGGQKASENYGVQTKLGEAAAEIDAAYVITEKMVATVFDGLHGEIDRVRNRRDLVYVVRLLKSGVDRLFDMAGARGLQERIALQRHWRDIHAISNHAAFGEVQFQTAGRAALTQKPHDSEFCLDGLDDGDLVSLRIFVMLQRRLAWNHRQPPQRMPARRRPEHPVPNTTIPAIVFIAYQMMFAIITPALIRGAFANRVTFKAYMLFLTGWLTFVYFPFVHMIWVADPAAVGRIGLRGGIVVHNIAGIAALASVLYVGRRPGRTVVRTVFRWLPWERDCCGLDGTALTRAAKFAWMR